MAPSPFRIFLMAIVILSFVGGGIAIGLGASGLTPLLNNGPPVGVIVGVALILFAGGCGFMVFMEAGHPALRQTTSISSPLHRAPIHRKIALQHVTVAVQPH